MARERRERHSGDRAGAGTVGTREKRAAPRGVGREAAEMVTGRSRSRRGRERRTTSSSSEQVDFATEPFAGDAVRKRDYVLRERRDVCSCQRRRAAASAARARRSGGAPDRNTNEDCRRRTRRRVAVRRRVGDGYVVRSDGMCSESEHMRAKTRRRGTPRRAVGSKDTAVSVRRRDAGRPPRPTAVRRAKGTERRARRIRRTAGGRGWRRSSTDRIGNGRNGSTPSSAPTTSCGRAVRRLPRNRTTGDAESPAKSSITTISANLPCSYSSSTTSGAGVVIRTSAAKQNHEDPDVVELEFELGRVRRDRASSDGDIR